MVQRKHLPEGEIQRLERMDGDALLGELAMLSEQKRAVQFHELLVAYRLAARVANRAFAYVEEPSPVHQEALRDALAGYAPEHFAEGERSLEEHIASLIFIYELVGAGAASPEFLEPLYRLIKVLQKN